MAVSTPIIVGATVGGGVLFICLCLPFIICCVYCCIKCCQSKHSSRGSHQFPKFRVIDTPNATFLRKAVFTDKEASFTTNEEISRNGFGHHQQENGERSRSPAKLPPTDTINELSVSDYALPNEIRILPFHKKECWEDRTKSIPIHRQRASTDGQIPSRKEGYGSTISSPSSCSDYTSPVISDCPSSPSSLVDPQNIYMTPETNEELLYIQIKTLNVPHIDRTTIEVHGELGSGNFGRVVKCTYNEGIDKQRDVAVKTLKETSETIEKIKFLQEAAIMGQFHHRNVVKLFGVVVSGTPLMIVLELLPKGDLRHFLNDIKPDKHSRLPELLIKFCREIASGVEYLSKKCFIHRDLAARNILLSKQLTCKIGDFGLARDLMDEEYYFSRGGVIPVKWTAPEALNYRKYSMASDVWSFGCLLYEIWSLGHKPYGRKTNKEVLKLLEEGTRLQPPPGCTRSIYFLMIQCWHPSPSSRPCFTDIVNYLGDEDDRLLSWTESDKQCCGPDGRTLGTSLSTSESLYIDLQLTYASL